MAGKSQGDGYYFIYLTNWAHISYNTYLIVAAVSTSTKQIMVYRRSRQQNTTHSRDYLTAGEPAGYWNTSGNQLDWYQMVYWVLFTIGNELATCIMVLYFLLIYRGDEIDGVDANTHLTNGLLSLVDLWISGLPVNFLHFVYIV